MEHIISAPPRVGQTHSLSVSLAFFSVVERVVDLKTTLRDKDLFIFFAPTPVRILTCAETALVAPGG